MTMSVKSAGFRELDRMLAKLQGGIPEAKLRAALHAGGELIAAEARRIVPVDTGTLRDSIAVTDDRDARIYGKVNAPGVSVYVGPVGSTEDGDVYYAKFQEFGWLDNPGTPFMRPAIAAKRLDAEKLVVTLMKRDLLSMAQ
jgi:HK97 gp10 family phage protein